MNKFVMDEPVPESWVLDVDFQSGVYEVGFLPVARSLTGLAHHWVESLAGESHSIQVTDTGTRTRASGTASLMTNGYIILG